MSALVGNVTLAVQAIATHSISRALTDLSEESLLSLLCLCTREINLIYYQLFTYARAKNSILFKFIQSLRHAAACVSIFPSLLLLKCRPNGTRVSMEIA
jgi:hypothetical protein